MEATGRYARALHRFLFEKGHVVSVVNPQRTCNFVKSRMARTKSDKADADAIAWFCASQKPQPTPPLPPEKLQLQDITRRIHDLKNERQRERNRLKAGLEAAAVEKDIKQNLKHLEKRIKLLEDEATQLLDQYPELAQQVTLLISIKGIAFITAVILVAEIPMCMPLPGSASWWPTPASTPRTPLQAPASRKSRISPSRATRIFVPDSLCPSSAPSAGIHTFAHWHNASKQRVGTKWSSTARPCVKCFTLSTAS
jgi:hypothetical protein